MTEGDTLADGDEVVYIQYALHFITGLTAREYVISRISFGIVNPVHAIAREVSVRFVSLSLSYEFLRRRATVVAQFLGKRVELVSR